MLRVSIGHSHDPDSQAAISEILKQIHVELAGVSPNAGLLFAAIDFDHTLILNQIITAFPGIALIGGTTDGEMSSVLGFEQDSLTLIVFCTDIIRISAGIGCNLSKDVSAATSAAVQQASAIHTSEIKLCISLPESLTTSSALILDSLTQALGEKVPVFGGITADQWRFQQTYQFFQTEVYSDAVPILLFSGPILFSHGIASGWHPISRPGQVTKAERNVIYEIDGQPALKFYQRYFGTLPPSSEYPLAIFEANSNQYYIRAPNGIYDRDVGSISFFGDVPVGSKVQITETTHDAILSASQLSTQQALDDYPGDSPATALFFSCASRRQILGVRTEEEHNRAQKSLKQSIPNCGFYTNGEISPLQKNGSTYFHNEAFVTLLLGEADTLSDAGQLSIKMQEMEKTIRILNKKLERSENTCFQLQENNHKKESLLRQVINELKESQSNVETQSFELEQALKTLQQTQSQLIQVEKMSSLGQLVAGVAHELNNPVCFIYGNLTHLDNYTQDLIALVHIYQEYYPNPPKILQERIKEIDLEFLEEDIAKLLKSTQNGSERIKDIVSLLRSFSRLDEVGFKSADVHECIKNTLTILQYKLRILAIEVIEKYANIPLIECNSEQLNQVFISILENAIDALEDIQIEQKIIQISTELIDNEWIEVQISDNGVGIPEEVMSRIFDPFFTTKSVGKGTGMGLSISYQIVVEEHGGYLHCKSVPDKGTKLTIKLPISR